MNEAWFALFFLAHCVSSTDPTNCALANGAQKNIQNTLLTMSSLITLLCYRYVEVELSNEHIKTMPCI